MLRDSEIRQIGEQAGAIEGSKLASKNYSNIFQLTPVEAKPINKKEEEAKKIVDPVDTITIRSKISPPFSGVDAAFPPGVPGRPIDWRGLPHINIPGNVKDIGEGRLTLPKVKIEDVQFVNSNKEKPELSKGEVKINLIDKLTKERGEDCWVKNINDIGKPGYKLEGEAVGGTDECEDILAIPDEGNNGCGQNVYFYKDGKTLLVTSYNNENQALLKYPDGGVLSKEFEGDYSYEKIMKIAREMK